MPWLINSVVDTPTQVLNNGTEQTTIQPTDVRIEIRVPEGMEVRSMSDGLRREGDVVVYDGIPDRSLEVRVSFSPPLPTRMWRNVTRVFTQPLFHV